MLEIGTPAPNFNLPDQNGVMHSLAEYAGQKVVLFFYAKDNTAGCSKQACGFGELLPLFSEKGATIIGISKDSVASHKRFEEKFNLPFTLLADTELEAIKAYEVWGEKKPFSISCSNRGNGRTFTPSSSLVSSMPGNIPLISMLLPEPASPTKPMILSEGERYNWANCIPKA